MRNPSSDLRAFVGRAAERSQLTDLIAAAADGRSQVALIVGEGGSGKTMLVDQVERSLLDGFTVLRADADEYSTTAALAVMSQLGVDGSTTPFSAGLELLDRLNSLQASGPVAVLVEDLHWADTASRQALLTTARRFREDRVVMIATTRPLEPLNDDWGRFSLDRERCHRVLLDGFGDGDIVDLARVSGIELTRTQADRLRRHTDGLPLHLHTLLLELPEAELRSTATELVVPRSLAAATVATVSTLPSEARAMAGALSASPQAAPSALVARVAGVEHPADALDTMLATSLFHWSPHDDGTPIGFTHPLPAHGDLRRPDTGPSTSAASRLGGARAGWCRACTPRGGHGRRHDDELADELSAAAVYEIERGEHGMAATHLLWAAELTSRRDAGRGTPAPSGASALRRRPVRACGGVASDLGDVRPHAVARHGGGHVPLRARRRVEGRAVVVVVGDRRPGAGSRRVCEGRRLWAARHAVHAPRPGGRRRAGGDQRGRARAGRQGSRAQPLVGDVVRSSDATWPGGRVGTPRAALAGVGVSRPRPGDATLLILPRHARVPRRTNRDWDRRHSDCDRVGPARLRLVAASQGPPHLVAVALLAAGEWDEAIVHARTTLSLTEDGRFWLREQAQAAVAQVLASRGDWAAADASLAALSAADADLRTIESSVTYSLAAVAVAAPRDDPSRLLDAVDRLGPGARTPAITELTRLVWLPARSAR